jgi:hypothetical protein
LIHNAVDDHARLAYSKVLTNEHKQTVAAFWQRANAFFNRHGITVERVLTDNTSCYRSRLFAQTLARPGVGCGRLAKAGRVGNGSTDNGSASDLGEIRTGVAETLPTGVPRGRCRVRTVRRR